MPTLIKTIGNINNGAISWNNAAGSAVIGSVTDLGAWTLGSGTGITDTSVGSTTINGVNGIARALVVRQYTGNARGIEVRSGDIAVGFGAYLRMSATEGATTSASVQLLTGRGSNDVGAATLNINAGQINFSGDQGGTVHGSMTSAGAWTLGVTNTPTNGTSCHFVQGTSTVSGEGILKITNTDTSASSDGAFGLVIQKGSATNSASQRYIRFLYNAGGGNHGCIVGTTGDLPAFAATSDARLKENVVGLSGQLANILALRPVIYDRIDNGNKGVTGFIAQEMQEIYPDCVAADQDDGYLYIAGWDVTSARLVKAIQELKAELDEAKAEIEILKGN